MTDKDHRQARATARPKSVRLAPLPPTAMTALLEGDLFLAGAEAGVALTGYFITDVSARVWLLRIDQLAADPGGAPWSTHAVVAEPEGIAVGYAGFHGPPDETGTVEIGYSVDPAYRRQGYAKATVRELLRHAGERAVRTVRASISPGNAASFATIAGFGFVKLGEQWDEEDGLEIVLEVTL